ncbi:MAG: hypothetical protein EA408_04710 [Marinilabiliales bacterium]|nr:MAG: hypothetical protein EA408_04710 [Marinilabiliales bacterium]
MVILFAGKGMNSYGQLYDTGVGARLGFFNGLTVKHFMQEGRAVEGILSTRWDGFIITGLYQFQRPLSDIDNLEWFYGGGLHAGFWQTGRYHFDGSANSVIGLDLILGVEYTIEEIPFSISLDWKPAFNVIGNTSWWGDGAALSIRYTFR